MTLLPCPFCGGRAEIGGHVFAYYARCVNRDCIASTYGAHYPDAVDAVDAWNRRPAPASPDVEGAIEALGKAVARHAQLHRLAERDDRLNGQLDDELAEAKAAVLATIAAAKAAAVAAAVLAERERCARLAEQACLVPPDGGSPTDDEKLVADAAAAAIRARPRP